MISSIHHFCLLSFVMVARYHISRMQPLCFADAFFVATCKPNRSTDLHHSFCLRRRLPNLNCSAFEIFIPHFIGGKNPPKPPKFDQIFDNSFRTSSLFSPSVLSSYWKSRQNSSSAMMPVHIDVYSTSVSPGVSCLRVLLGANFEKLPFM
jgi:hypothetical protein